MDCDFFMSIADLEEVLKGAKEGLKNPKTNQMTFKVLAPASSSRDYLTGGVALDRERKKNADKIS